MRSFCIELMFIGPALVLLAVIIVIATPRRLQLIAVAVPAIAFLTTYALAYRASLLSKENIAAGASL